MRLRLVNEVVCDTVGIIPHFFSMDRLYVDMIEKGGPRT